MYLSFVIEERTEILLIVWKGIPLLDILTIAVFPKVMD